MDPSRTALLVMGLQRGIVERLGDEALLARLAEATSAARKAGVLVIYVRIAFRSGHPEVSPRNLPFARIAESEQFLEGPSSEIHPALEVHKRDIVVTKRRISAFSGSDLDLLLRSRGIDSLVLSGIATGGVVLSTLCQAADLDFALAVLADGCAESDPQLHELLMEKLFPRHAQVLSVAEWLAALKKLR